MPGLPLRLAVLFTMLALPCSAAASCPSGEHWVRVRVGEGWDAQVREAVLADLQAELGPLGIEACTENIASDAPDALADVELGRDAEVVSVVIEVRDAVTDKRVGRDVPLSDVAEAARPLTIALAVVELLRASWIELRLRSAPEPAREVPAVVEEAVAADEEPPPPPPPGPAENALGLSAVFEHSVGGLTQLGGALRYQRWLIDELGVGLSFGGRYGLPMQSDQGRIETGALSAGVDMRVAISPRDEVFYGGFELGARVLVLRFDGSGEPGIDGSDATDVALSVRAAVLGRVRIADALGLEATLGVGVPVLGLLATDGEGVVGGVETFEVVVSLGPTLEI